MNQETMFSAIHHHLLECGKPVRWCALATFACRLAKDHEGECKRLPTWEFEDPHQDCAPDRPCRRRRERP